MFLISFENGGYVHHFSKHLSGFNGNRHSITHIRNCQTCILCGGRLMIPRWPIPLSFYCIISLMLLLSLSISARKHHRRLLSDHSKMTMSNFNVFMVRPRVPKWAKSFGEFHESAKHCRKTSFKFNDSVLSVCRRTKIEKNDCLVVLSVSKSITHLIVKHYFYSFQRKSSD